MTTRSKDKKPKLIFFQYKYGERLPAFLLMHKGEHVKCLSQFFDVTVIDEDCDYSRVCDEHEPDLALFESGVPLPTCRRLKISGVRTSDRVPKLGFMHADGFCCGRSGFISDMDQWGIATFFALASTAAEHIPEMQDRLFIWPNFVDEELYHDYGQYKTIPVLFTGNKSGMYPWRQSILRRVVNHYPSLICPHSGYAPGPSTGRMVVGEPYARMLNASWFVPACGGVAKELVRKHLEIPACNACLVAEKTPILEAAGFTDMVNCVFAEPNTVIEKLRALFRDEARLSMLIAAGHDLVHSRHTIKHRDQVLQWYNLHRQLTPTQKIIQSGPFEPLTIVDRATRIGNHHVIAGGIHLALLREGDEKLWSGQLEAAEAAYLKCLNFISYMPEPQVRLAICNLLKGRPRTALSWVIKPLQFTLADYTAVDPDPVEWAYYLLALLCDGQIREAAKQAKEFSWLHHDELERARHVVFVCTNGDRALLQMGDCNSNRLSIHSLPERSLQQWLEHVCLMFVACGQSGMADKIKSNFINDFAQFSSGPKRQPPPLEAKKTQSSQHERHATKHTIARFQRYRTALRRRQLVRQVVRNVLHCVERHYGYFLPFSLSAARADELLSSIQHLLQDAQPASAVVIGASGRNGSTDAVLAGACEGKEGQLVFFLTPSQYRGQRLCPNAKWYAISRGDRPKVAVDVEEALKVIRATHGIADFDVLLVDGSDGRCRELPIEILLNEAQRSRYVFLINLRRHDIYTICESLRENSDFILVQHSPTLRSGYAYFERVIREQRLDHSPNNVIFSSGCKAN